ncbi:MAG: sugar-transfer associated ATP-grasp domain-containing protein, partial [Dongiaceae bacterium]
GGNIEGITLPYWQELVRLAELAHGLLADRVALRWDIAILPDGPCVIEANAFPDLNIPQGTMLLPLGSGRLADLMVYHLSRLHPAL